jgi:TP901 family phage tail tape measure protein
VQEQIAAIPAGAPGTPGADPASGTSVLATTFTDINKNNAEAKKEYTKAVKESTKEEQKNEAALNDKNKALKGNKNSVDRALNSVFKYGVALQFFRTIANQATRTVKELDKALTEQSIVTGKTRQETYKLLKSYQDLARETGYTTLEIAAIATQYFRQGKTQADALILTEAAAKAARISGISAGQSVNYLTTAVNGFMLSAKQAIDVSDKFAAIASQSASSYEELAIGLSKVASQANLAGMSIDYTLGLIAKGVETTREPAESIGTALKTIIARIRELSDYGRTLEDDMDLNNVEKQLQFVGVALRDQNGSLRSTQDVLDEIGRS